MDTSWQILIDKFKKINVFYILLSFIPMLLTLILLSFIIVYFTKLPETIILVENEIVDLKFSYYISILFYRLSIYILPALSSLIIFYRSKIFKDNNILIRFFHSIYNEFCLYLILAGLYNLLSFDIVFVDTIFSWGFTIQGFILLLITIFFHVIKVKKSKVKENSQFKKINDKIIN